MGTVWMAQQTEPVKRLVALKLIKAGMDSKQVIARFEAERQALALMDHANIARVLDAGTTSAGRPYFVMDLVQGAPITRYCDEYRLTPRQRLELFVPVCQAVQHAHQKGVIHRDLKPSNVLVALYDGQPVPKVIDFGVAKAAGQSLTDKTLVTGFGAIVGTLEYMSPEQAEINQLDIDTRSDIYSLGVLLYELLTGSPPFTRKELERVGILEMLRLIREQEPTKPSTKLSTAEGLPTLAANRGTEPAKLTKLVRGELDWIVMKALEKDRTRRYETANAFAADVQRYLADEPVLACPPSVGYRLRKFARRNKAGLAIAGLILLFIVLLGGVVGWEMRDRAAREQEIALDTARKLAQAEEGIRKALDRASKSRAELHAVLTGAGGVRELLNQPARWELFIKTGQGELAQARQLAGRAEGSLDANLTQAMDRLDQQLTSDQADYDLALRLEKIRLIASTTLDGKSLNSAKAAGEYPRRSRFGKDVGRTVFNTAQAVREYQQAFAEAGLAVEPGRQQETAARVGKSAIKHQLLAGLDDWAFWAFVHRQHELCHRVLAVARLADPDPWRDQVRDPTLWKKREAFVRLAEQAQADPERFRQLTPQMLEWIGLVLGDEEAGEAWLRRAQALHPADFWLNFSLALRLKTTEGAIGFYRAALAVRPQSTAVYNDLGIVLRCQKNLAGAIDAYEKALAIDPEFAVTWHNLTNALADSKDLPGAIKAHKKALALDGQAADGWTSYGATLHHSKDLPGAIHAFKKAIAIDPQYANAWHNLGIALHDSKDLPGAIDACKKALAIDEQSAGTWANLGAALYGSKDLPGAIDALTKAVAIDPQNAKTWNYLGLALADSKDLPGAIEAHKKGW
jgi:tetratricopeptide (TPR) repeat protein